MDQVFNDSISNDSVESDTIKGDDHRPYIFRSYEAVKGVELSVSLEKFIVLCRTRLNDPPNRRKKRYSGLHSAVARYNNSHYWNPITFHNLLEKFTEQLESDQIDHDKADAIFKDLLKELLTLSGQSRRCSGKCRKRKKKAKKETTVCKLEKSLAVVQRRINRLKDASSANAWEVRDSRDSKCLKLHGMQKKALRLTKKISELGKLASTNTNATNLASLKVESTDEAIGSSGGSGNSSGFNSNSEMDELNCLLKSVRLKESVKLKPKVIYKIRPDKDIPRRSAYPRIEMVEIKKYDQQNQCYVESTTKKSISSKPMPFKIIRQKVADGSNSTLSSYQSLPGSPNDTINSSDLKYVNNKSPTKKRSEMHKLRKQSTFDLICDRFRHVTLNS